MNNPPKPDVWTDLYGDGNAGEKIIKNIVIKSICFICLFSFIFN